MSYKVRFGLSVGFSSVKAGVYQSARCIATYKRALLASVGQSLPIPYTSATIQAMQKNGSIGIEGGSFLLNCLTEVDTIYILGKQW